MADLYGPKNLTAPAGAIILNPGMDVNSIVKNAPAGATFWFQAGEYRGVSIEPKDNQSFLGAEGAVLNGSNLLTDFTQDSAGRWVASGQTQEGLRSHTEDAAMRAGYPETFFIDDKPLTPVDALSKVAPGTFYFDYEADRIYFADDPTGHKVEAGVKDHAFVGEADGVTIRNLVIEKYNPPVQTGAIQGHTNWTIADNEIRLNYAVGATAQDGSVITGNFVHDNGQMGLGGNGKNVRVEGNEIASNGHWSGIDVFWEGGGAKFSDTDGLIVRANYSHDNKGFGLWTDIDNIRTVYEDNLLVKNSGGGITHEISYDAVIRNNTLIGNGFEAQGDGWLWGGAIQNQNSKNVEIYGNRIDTTGASGGNGIVLIQQDRGSGAYGDYLITNNKIHDNTIVSKDGNGISGGVADFNEAGLLNGGNVWDNNKYYMPDGDHWWWGDFDGDDDWASYMKYTNQDENSTLSQSYPDMSTWMTIAQETSPVVPTPTPTPTPPTPNEPVVDEVEPTVPTTPTPNVATITVNASGTPAGGVNAHFNLLVDGKKVGEGVAGTSAKDFTFTTNLTADQAHKVQIQYDNDGVVNGQDRNLFVNKVTINGKVVTPTDSSVTYDKGALDGKDVVKGQSALWWGGTLVVDAPAADFPAGGTLPQSGSSATKITVNASGTSAGGVNAHFNLLVDGKKVGEGVADTSAKDFTFTTSLTADQAHNVQIQYDNDGVVNGQDRNLFVNKVTINGKAVTPTDSSVTYDKGALDGKDVAKGQSAMWWGGTLVVSADKSYFPAATAAGEAQPLAMDIAADSVWSHIATQQAEEAAPVALADAMMVEAANAGAVAESGYGPLFDYADPSLLAHAV